MDFTTKEIYKFKEWEKEGYSSWTNYSERVEALTREFIKTLTDKEIKDYFILGKRNSLLSSKNITLFHKMTAFIFKVKDVIGLKPKKKDLDNFKNTFDDIYDIRCDDNTKERVVSLLSNRKVKGLTLQNVLTDVFQGGYYSIPYGQPRTIEHNHNAEVLHAIYNKFGGCVIIKTTRKVLGVKFDIGHHKTATPIPIIEAINLLKEIRDKKFKKVKVSDNDLKELKEKAEMNEVVKKI